MEPSKLPACPLLVGIKGSTAFYELVVVHLKDYGQSCHSHCTFNLPLSEINVPLKNFNVFEKRQAKWQLSCSMLEWQS